MQKLNPVLCSLSKDTSGSALPDTLLPVMYISLLGCSTFCVQLSLADISQPWLLQIWDLQHPGFISTALCSGLSGFLCRNLPHTWPWWLSETLGKDSQPLYSSLYLSWLKDTAKFWGCLGTYPCLLKSHWHQWLLLLLCRSRTLLRPLPVTSWRSRLWRHLSLYSSADQASPSSPISASMNRLESTLVEQRCQA